MNSVSFPPVGPDPGIPRPRRILYDHPEPGTIHIARKRATPGVPATHVIRVGKIHITRRNINPDTYVCKICGHPYDHGGTAHSAAEAARRVRNRGPIQRGELLTGPDGLMYRYDGVVWIQR